MIPSVCSALTQEAKLGENPLHYSAITNPWPWRLV